MPKKIILICLIVGKLCIWDPAYANWLSSAANAFKSVGSAAATAVSGAAKDIGNIVSTSASSGLGLGASAQLSYCRQIAAVPGGVNTMEYQSQCGNMAFVCQQLRMTNPQVAVDPYCATVSGMGQMVGPWGGTTSSFMPGLNTTATPANTDPNKIGWSTPPPPPYGFTMGMGAYGVAPTGIAGVASLLTSSAISRFFGGNGSGGYGGVGGYGGMTRSGPTYSADYLDDE